MFQDHFVAKITAVLSGALLLASCGGGQTDAGGAGEPAETAEILPRTISDEMPAYEAAQTAGPKLNEEGDDADVDAAEADAEEAEAE